MSQVGRLVRRLVKEHRLIIILRTTTQTLKLLTITLPRICFRKCQVELTCSFCAVSHEISGRPKGNENKNRRSHVTTGSARKTPSKTQNVLKTTKL